MTKVQMLEIFSIVLSAGSSDRYSITFDYDTEFNECELFFFYCADKESIESIDCIFSRSEGFDDLLGKLRDWTAVIRNDKKEQGHHEV